jgi:poly-D-alanine transfer protein DltD
MVKDRSKVSQWQLASIEVNNIRWKINNLLKGFPEVAVYQSIKDVSPEEAEGIVNYNSNKINWKSWQLWTLILGSPVVVQLMTYIPAIYSYLVGLLSK